MSISNPTHQGDLDCFFINSEVSIGLLHSKLCIPFSSLSEWCQFLIPTGSQHCSKQEFWEIQCTGSSPHFMSSVQAPQPIKSDPEHDCVNLHAFKPGIVRLPASDDCYEKMKWGKHTECSKYWLPSLVLWERHKVFKTNEGIRSGHGS